VPAKKTKTFVSTSQISQTRQARVEKVFNIRTELHIWLTAKYHVNSVICPSQRMEASFESTAMMEMEMEDADLAHKTPPRVPPKPTSKSPTPPTGVSKVAATRHQSPSPVRPVKAPIHTPHRWSIFSKSLLLSSNIFLQTPFSSAHIADNWTKINSENDCYIMESNLFPHPHLWKYKCKDESVFCLFYDTLNIFFSCFILGLLPLQDCLCPLSDQWSLQWLYTSKSHRLQMFYLLGSRRGMWESPAIPAWLLGPHMFRPPPHLSIRSSNGKVLLLCSNKPVELLSKK